MTHEEALNQLNTLKEALLEAHKVEISKHRCEFHIPTSDPTISPKDLPTCRCTVTCIGETPNKRNQYWLCEEHGKEWTELCKDTEGVKPGREGRVIEPWTRFISILSEIDDTLVFDNGAVTRKDATECATPST